MYNKFRKKKTFLSIKKYVKTKKIEEKINFPLNRHSFLSIGGTKLLKYSTTKTNFRRIRKRLKIFMH